MTSTCDTPPRPKHVSPQPLRRLPRWPKGVIFSKLADKLRVMFFSLKQDKLCSTMRGGGKIKRNFNPSVLNRKQVKQPSGGQRRDGGGGRKHQNLGVLRAIVGGRGVDIF